MFHLKKNMVVQKPFCRGFSTFRCLFKFTSGQVSLTFVVASSIFFTSPLKVVPISVTSAPNESSGIFWDHESWLKKNEWIRESSGNIDISQFLDGKSKKVSKPAKHTSSRFGYFPTTVGYTVRRLIFETLTTSSPLWYSQSFFVNSPWNCWFSWWNPGASWLCWFGTLPCRGTGWCLIS